MNTSKLSNPIQNLGAAYLAKVRLERALASLAATDGTLARQETRAAKRAVSEAEAVLASAVEHALTYREQL